MNEVLSESIKSFKNSNTIGLYCPRINSMDKVDTILVFSEICKLNKKTLEVFSPLTPSPKYSSILESRDIVIKKEFRSKQYIVSIDYGTSNVEKVICKRDEKTNKLNFVITPGDATFSFDNVELIPGGSNLELIIFLGVNAKDFENEPLKTLDKNIKSIVMAKKDISIGTYKLLINGNKSYSELAFEFAKSFSSTLNKSILDDSLTGILSKHGLSDTGLIMAGTLVKYGANFNSAMNKVFYSKSYANLDLQIKVMHNVRVDKRARAIWSIVSKEDVKNCGVNLKSLDTKGRIVFNISKDFDVAFVIYHITSKLSKIVIEVNDTSKFSAKDLLKNEKAKGDSSRVVATITGESSKVIEDSVMKVIESVMGVDFANSTRMNFGTQKTDNSSTEVVVL